jgi:hypothetical protein
MFLSVAQLKPVREGLSVNRSCDCSVMSLRLRTSGTVLMRVQTCEGANYLYRKHNDYARNAPDESNEYPAESSLEAAVVRCNVLGFCCPAQFAESIAGNNCLHFPSPCRGTGHFTFALPHSSQLLRRRPVYPEKL